MYLPDIPCNKSAAILHIAAAKHSQRDNHVPNYNNHYMYLELQYILRCNGSEDLALLG